MFRRIFTVSATALTVGVLALTPLAALAIPSDTALIPVSATVAPTASVTDVTPATTTTWDGSATQAVPFIVAVNSNDSAGYSFMFTGANGPSFTLIGTGGNATTVAYTVAGTGPDGTIYSSGIEGTFAYPGPTPVGGTETTFNVGLPVQQNIAADSYTDTLTVTVTTLNLT